MPAITTFLMFEGAAEAAMQLYIETFPNARVERITRYGTEGPGAEGSVVHATFTLAGQRFMCIDSPAKHAFTFTPSVSLYVECETRDEVDRVYAKLGEGGQVMMPLGEYPFNPRFAWIADRFGVSWQLALAQ